MPARKVKQLTAHVVSDGTRAGTRVELHGDGPPAVLSQVQNVTWEFEEGDRTADVVIHLGQVSADITGPAVIRPGPSRHGPREH